MGAIGFIMLLARMMHTARMPPGRAAGPECEQRIRVPRLAWPPLRSGTRDDTDGQATAGVILCCGILFYGGDDERSGRCAQDHKAGPAE